MTSESARRFHDDIQRSWQPLRELAESLRSRLEEKTPAGWTAKEMLGTIAFWDEAAFGWITLGIRQGQLLEGWTFGSGFDHSQGWPAADVHNAREAEWARSRTVDEVLERCGRAHEQLLAIIDTVTDEESEKNSDYFPQLGGHYRDHLPELQALASEARA